MNYVAHILLTHPLESISLGNAIGDMVRNRELDELQRDVRQGVMIHRYIDSFTDQHEAIKKVVPLLRATHGKYAPVVLDILLDRILVCEWDDYSPVSFSSFENWMYEVIASNAMHLPERIAPRITKMAEHNWLSDYRSDVGLNYVLEFMDRRATFPSSFTRASEDLEKYRNDLSDALRAVWAELQPIVNGMAGS